MQSNNPVFRRSEEFHASGANAYGNQTYAGNGSAYQGYGQTGYSNPATWGTGAPGQPSQQPGTGTPAVDRGPMTIDSVVQKTAISLGVVIVAALATWILTPSLDDAVVDLGPISAAVTIGPPVVPEAAEPPAVSRRQATVINRRDVLRTGTLSALGAGAVALKASPDAAAASEAAKSPSRQDWERLRAETGLDRTVATGGGADDLVRAGAVDEAEVRPWLVLEGLARLA